MSHFWERRKAAVAEEARAESAALIEAEALEQEQALAERTDEELLAETGLKAPEALESAEEVQDFLKAALPQRLKTRALRRLWRLNPVLANLDGLVDYGEDFTDSATVVENMATVYQVGKGMFDKVLDTEREAEALAETAPEPDAETTTEAEVERDIDEVAAITVPVANTAPALIMEDTADAPVPLRARRMQFRFDDAPGTAGQERNTSA